MKYLITLTLFSLVFFSSCKKVDETLPDNIFTGDTDFVTITGHSYLDEIYKGRIEFELNYDAISAAQRERITGIYLKYYETSRSINDLEQRTFVFPAPRGEEICIKFGLLAGSTFSNPGPETCIVF